MSRGTRIFITLASIGVSMTAVGLLLAIPLFYYFGRDLPDYSKLTQYTPAGTTRLYADDGHLMAEYATQRRIFMPLENMPTKLIHAFIAAEDQNYYHHTGIDAMGIVRAAVDNITNIGQNKSLVGASTITQQVAKNFLLTNEKSLSRKIKEAIIAYRITKLYNKDRILELYLNEIYLGMGTYGVVAAADQYFNKTLEELSTEEMALLAAMPKAPANYDRRFHKERAVGRRNYVLERMYDDGYINLSEAERAKAAELVIYESDDKSHVNDEYFSEEVRRELVERYGTEGVYEHGLFVRTTMNPDMQKLADNSLRNALIAYDLRHGYRGPLGQVAVLEGWQDELNEYAKEGASVYDKQKLAVVLTVEKDHAVIGFRDGEKAKLPFSGMKWARRVLKTGRMGSQPKDPKDVVTAKDIVLVVPAEKDDVYDLIQVPKVNGGLIVLQPKTGKVLAMAGGYDPRKDEFNRVTQAKRQPGSAFKPFVYLTALERGFTPSSIVVDEPVEIYQGPGLPLWRPKNYGGDFLGPATLRMGLEKSRNVMTVRLAQMLGIHRIVKVAERFGIYDDPPANYSMVLGAQETTLLRLASAYGMIVNGGLKVKPAFIERIDNQKGETIFRLDDRSCPACAAQPGQKFSSYAPPRTKDERERVLDPRIAYQVTSLLQGVVQRGTATAASRIGKPLAGKTGTTNDSRDAWFMGFSPDLVVGVYIGFDQPKSLGSRETGGRVALPAFIDVMKTALDDRPVKGFRTPKGIQHMVVDRYTGMPPIPGIESGGTITEAFLYGGSIFIPGDEADDMAVTEGEYPLVYTDENGNVINSGVYDPAVTGGMPMQQPEGFQAIAPEDVPAAIRHQENRYQGYRSNREVTGARPARRFGPTGAGTGTLY